VFACNAKRCPIRRAHDSGVNDIAKAEVEAESRHEDFEDFFAAERGRLVRACLLLTGNVADAEDLAQEALSRVLERWTEVARMASPVGYLYRTAVNLNRKRLRRLAVAARRFVDREERDDLMAANERLDILRAMASLPRPQREALVLIEWLGYSAEQTGALLGIEAVSVRARLHRARTSLRRALEDST
jgi:RNA polymerase sigma factor (sigma-70 family)